MGELDVMEDQVNDLSRMKNITSGTYCYYCINEDPFVDIKEFELDLRKLSHCLANASNVWY